jgi:hypothetical protein
MSSAHDDPPTNQPKPSGRQSPRRSASGVPSPEAPVVPPTPPQGGQESSTFPPNAGTTRGEHPTHQPSLGPPGEQKTVPPQKGRPSPEPGQSPSPAETGDDLQQTAPDVKPQKPGKGAVSTALLNFWLDAALFLSVTFVVWVSVMMQYVFPPPTSADGWELWGLSFDQWRDAQFYALCVVALLAIEHLVLHWNWVCSVLATKVLRVKGRPDKGNQAIYGVGTFITILTLILASLLAASLSVKRPPSGRSPRAPERGRVLDRLTDRALALTPAR